VMKPQLREVEKLVNEKIRENAPVSWKEIAYDEAKKRADIMQFFGDKYGERVRVVQIGGTPDELDGYSMELCGGTHVRATADIGLFRIVSEGAIAAGIRRVEAVAGNAVGEWARAEAGRQEEKFRTLANKKPGLLPLPALASQDGATLVASIEERAAHLERVEKEVHDWGKEKAKSAGAALQKRGAEIAQQLLAAHSAEKSLAIEIPDADGALLQAVVDAMKGQFSGPDFLAGVTDGRVDLVAAVPQELTAKFQAGALIQKLAPIVGGKGGGRPDNARGAGREVAKISEVVAQARAFFAAKES
jgi:alanyl-tRNA synthetase